MSFSGFACLGAAAQFLSDRIPGLGWMRRATRVSDVPAAMAGAGLSTYTASLLSATSTPLWAAAPRSLAVRFGASSVAAGAASLSLRRTIRAPPGVSWTPSPWRHWQPSSLRPSHRTRPTSARASPRRWTVAGDRSKRSASPPWERRCRWAFSLRPFVLARRRPGILSDVASVAVLAGSLLLRVSMLSSGDRSAERPGISFRFSQPENLP